MKRYIISMMACIALLFASCQQEQIVFDHEQQQFATLENAILVELIAPIGTAVDEEIYIIGAFNGMDEKSVIGNVAWQLEKAELSDKKWGIYLFPGDFVDGKTLADGFCFVSKKSGLEYTIKGEPATHSLNASIGQMYNVWADRWASYFSSDEEQVQHDGPVVYVLDESGFGQLNLYMWGDVNDLNGGWPGMAVTGTETINGMELKYFDIGVDNEGLSETLIFSDNGNNQLADYGPVVLTSSEPLYLHITAEGTIEELNMENTIEHDGAAVYILDGMEWGMNTTLYMWGDVNNLNGGWPGMVVTGTEKIGDYTYMYFDMGEANTGLNENLIFSNNGSNQLADYAYTIGENIYLYLTSGGAQLIEDPANPGDVVWFDPLAQPVEPKEEAVIDLYIYNATDTLTPLNLYAWGSKDVFGGWPGAVVADMEQVAMLNLPLLHTQISGFVGDEFNLIFNNNAGSQLADYNVKAAETTNAYYIKVTDTEVTPLSLVAQLPAK